MTRDSPSCRSASRCARSHAPIGNMDGSGWPTTKGNGARAQAGSRCTGVGGGSGSRAAQSIGCIGERAVRRAARIRTTASEET